MTEFYNLNSQSIINDFENEMYISHIYDNALNHFINMEFKFLSDNTDYIYLSIYQSYSDLPFLFSKRLFYLLSNNKEKLYKYVYIKTISLIFLGSLEDKIKFLFDYLAFENEIINKKDIHIFFNNIILDLSSNYEKYEDDLNKYINYIFSLTNSKDKINYEEFKNILSNHDSGIYYIFYLYFSHYKSFNVEILNFLNSLININQRKNIKYSSPTKSCLDSSTTISDFLIENDNSNISPKKRHILRKSSAFKITKKEILLTKNIQISFYQILKDIFLNQKNNFSLYLNHYNYNELKDINEEDYYSDNESLNELNEFENEFIQIISNTCNLSDIKSTIITESTNNSPTITSKTKECKLKKKRNSISSINSKSIFTDLNEYESILVYFKINNEDKNYFYTLISNYLFLFNNKKIILIPCKRLFLEEKKNVKFKSNEYYNLEFISCINDLNFCFYFEDKYKLSLFKTIFHSKQNLPSMTDVYKIYDNKIIGKGNFSKVYLCKKYSNNKIYCMKEINRDFNNESNQLFNRKILNKEIDISKNFLKKKNNSSIIHCEDIFETKDKVYITFTYYKQGNLNYFLDKYYESPIQNINNERLITIDNILKQLISIFKYIEKFGITHRDIKPDNILISYNSKKDFKLHLTDFGFSNIGLYNQKMDGCLGTLIFTAPEIIITDFYYRNVDTWSLGILAFLLLFDITPFDINNEDDDINSVKKKIIQNKFNFPYNRIDKNELDIKIRKFIKKCLVKDKNKRPRISEIEYI